MTDTPPTAAPGTDQSKLDSLERLLARDTKSTVGIGGTVTEVAPTYCRVSGISRYLKLGDCVNVVTDDHSQLSEVVRIDNDGATVIPFEVTTHARLGSVAWWQGSLTIYPDESWKGRTLNALAEPIDGAPPLILGTFAAPLDREPPAPLRRQRTGEHIKTGIRAIDMFTPICAGQRIGVFAGSGIGKSTFLAMLAKAKGFDTIVLALVGERGREVREFLEDALGADRERVVAIVSSGDESPMMRRLAPKTAMCIAEHFRDLGDNVLLITDSITRFAHASREVSLSAGEPPVARGYTPSVFADLPKLLERAGPGEEGQGTITGVFSVLVDGDDHNDPVADCIRGILDGHIVLDRALADRGQYPAVNLLMSLSRLADKVWSPEQRQLVTRLKSMIDRFEDTRDLRVMGGYQEGTDQELDNAVALVPVLFDALKQNPDSPPSTDAFQELAEAMTAPPQE